VRPLTNFNFILRFSFQGALGKVYLLATFTAHMCTVKLIRKDFFFFSTVWTFTAKGFEMLELSKAGTMLWSGHDILLFQRSLYNAWSISGLARRQKKYSVFLPEIQPKM
jgi:hypothetical protein